MNTVISTLTKDGKEIFSWGFPIEEKNKPNSELFLNQSDEIEKNHLIRKGNNLYAEKKAGDETKLEKIATIFTPSKLDEK